MASYVEIGNFAASKLGHDEFITSLTEDSKIARLINVNYEQVRDEVLRDHTWNFATKRTILAPSVVTPEWGTEAYFPLPSDCIRVISEEDLYAEYRIESSSAGRCIVFDGTEFNLKYVARIEDPEQFDSLFVNAYSTKLAQRIAIPMLRDKGVYDRLGEMYKADLAMARHVGSSEAGIETVTSDTFLSYRV